MFEGCDRSRGANKELCSGHYQQRHSGRELTPLRKVRMATWEDDNTCSFPGCDRDKRRNKTLCGPHMKQRRSGQPLVPLRNRSGAWTLEGLLQRTSREGDCQIWVNGNAKRGDVWHENQHWKAHRLAYHLATGEDVFDVPLRHRCANTLCINPGHVERAPIPKRTLTEAQKLDARPCSRAGCIWPVHARSLCEPHYQGAYRRGELSSAPYAPKFRSWTIEKVLANCDKLGNCFIWKGAPTSRYPDLRHNGVAMKVHRFVYQMSTGDPHIAGAQIHHTCANSRCVNPEHLQRASQADNVLEMLSRRDYEAQIAALQTQLRDLEDR